MLKGCKIRLKTDLYSKDTIMRTAYHYIDDYYIFLEKDDNFVVVNIIPKQELEITDRLHIKIEGEFRNELLNQEDRKSIRDDTKNIRKLILARAMYSTFIEEPEDIRESESEYSIDDITKDWFEEDKNE